MALALVQTSAAVGASGATLTANITFGSAVAAGSTLVVLISQTVAGVRDYTVTDNIHGASGWAAAEASASDIRTAIWYRANHNGGTVTVSVTHGLATVGFRAMAMEWSGYGATVTVDDSDSLDEGVSATSHTCSSLGVTSTNECVAFCACGLNATATECNPGSGYSEVPTAEVHNRTLFQYQRFASGCTNETGAWSTTGIARMGRSSIALLSGPAGGGGGAATHNSLLLLGIG
jgi:hypothetical protein